MVMGRVLYKSRYRDLLAAGLLVWGMIALLRSPEHTTQAVKQGLALCANVILPSLFPFFVLSGMVVELGLSRYPGMLLQHIMSPLFRVSGSCACALVLGFVGGYPVGAKTAISLYKNGQCSKTEAERLLAFCNNAGPAFVLGVVGTGIFGSSGAGALLYLIHMTASLLVGLLFRFYRPSQHPSPLSGPCPARSCSLSAAFTRSVGAAVSASLNICAFVLFFTVMLRCLSLSGVSGLLSNLLAGIFAPLGLTAPWAQRLLTGLLELSSGVSSLAGGGSPGGRLSMAAFMLGWAGLSVHCQVLSFMEDSGLSAKTYFAGKALHGCFSAGLTALVFPLFPFCAPCICLADRVESISRLRFHQSAGVAVLCAVVTWLIFFSPVPHRRKKSSRKAGRHRV